MELNNSKTSNRIGQWSVTNIMDVSMPELCGDYESALDVPEWAWVKDHASFTHIETDEDSSVYEFIVNVATLDPCNTGHPFEAPEKLQPVIELAIQNGVGYILFYNDY